MRKKSSSISAAFEQFLKDYGCEYEVTGEDGTTLYRFEFQAGHFIAAIRKQDDCVEVTYPTIASAPMSQLALVRAKCNERNNSNILFKYTYSIDHEDNTVSIHLSFFNNHITSPEAMLYQLKAAFHFQREWLHDFDEAVRISKDYDSFDLESEVYKHEREMFMLRRLELAHQLGGKAGHITTGTGALGLWQLIETVAPLPDSELLFMNVNTNGGQTTLEDERAIKDYDLRHALVEGDGTSARPAHDYATLDLHYTQGQDKHPRMMVIALTAEGEDTRSIYTRVTLTLPPRNASRTNSITNERRAPQCVSLLIALDRSDDKRRQQEFDYMWSDALLKIKNGEQDSLTEEQELLSQIHVADVAYNLYWGQQLFNGGRFYEAILHLENVFNSYRENFFAMDGEHKRAFMEIAYKLGFCYNELGLYKQAFYYLDLMASDGNIRHTMELVNTMANNKDLRVFSYTDGVMEEVKNNFEEDEMPDNIRKFVHFLRRRRAHACIDFNELDQAEKVFTQMLDEEENADYAIQELAYIKELRRRRGDDADNEKAKS